MYLKKRNPIHTDLYILGRKLNLYLNILKIKVKGKENILLLGKCFCLYNCNFESEE